MYKRILVPVDGSDVSTFGLQEAVRLAKATQAQLRVMHVVDELVLFQSGAYIPRAGEFLEALTENGKQCLKTAKALAERHGVKAETAIFKTIGDRVAGVIVKEAKRWRADVVVMGTHGRRGVSHLLLGSDAEAVIKLTPVPVLLVRSQRGTTKRRTVKRK